MPKKPDNRPRKPNYDVGWRNVEITVVAVLSHSHNEPREEGQAWYDTYGDKEQTLLLRKRPSNGHVKGTWWYVIQCDCGNYEIVNQGQLRITPINEHATHNRKEKRRCRVCTHALSSAAQRENFRKKRELKEKPLSGVPDFARMKF